MKPLLDGNSDLAAPGCGAVNGTVISKIPLP